MTRPDPIVLIPDLPEKASLLYGHASYLDDAGKRVTIHSQKDLARALKADPGDLSRAMGGKFKRDNPEEAAQTATFIYAKYDGGTCPYLPRSKLPDFLRLFGLPGVPDQVQPKDEWCRLATITYELFFAEVKRKGGLLFVQSRWDQFVAAVQANSQSYPDGAGLFVTSAPANEWERTRQEVKLDRFQAKGQPNPVASAGGQVLHGGDLAQLELYVGDVIAFRPLHILMFQDVVLDPDSRRTFIPTLPSPPTEFVMPEPIIRNRDDLVVVPGDDRQQFEVPADWGPRRRVMALVTRREVSPDIYSPKSHGWEIRPDRLDYLAEQLDRKAYGEWALFVLDYLVLPRPLVDSDLSIQQH